MRSATDSRAEVLDLRLRIERTAVAAFVHVCRPEVDPPHTYTKARLSFLVAFAETDDDRRRIRRLVRLGVHVYRRTSDVLHGRMRSLALSDAVVEEWHGVVEGLEDVLPTA